MNINDILDNELCTGCGVCISEDKSKTAEMRWSENGFLIPYLTDSSTQAEMYEVCPFNITQLNEDILANKFFHNNEILKNDKIGYYNSLYAGYSKSYRKTSSSGGVATYVFNELLSQKVVDHLFVVIEEGDGFKYKWLKNIEDIKQISKTRYMPVTLEDLFKIIDNIEGKVAVSGVACFVKAIRLKQLKYPQYKDKIPFILGIICGGLKSKFYTDYLAQESNCFEEYSHVQYRVKNESSYALDYKFQCENKKTNKIHMVEMRTLGDMWGSGLFKNNACDFCDDVTTELADISLGDAWIEPYKKDGAGTNIIITRSKLARDIINKGSSQGELILDKLTENQVIDSQNGSFNHRHDGLKLRIKLAQNQKLLSPEKRKRILKSKNIIFNLVQIYRCKVRKESLIFWGEYRDVHIFKQRLSKSRNVLNRLNTWNHRFKKYSQILKKICKV